MQASNNKKALLHPFFRPISFICQENVEGKKEKRAFAIMQTSTFVSVSRAQKILSSPR